MRFQVPQNLDVPDTIFLGLDFKQLLYLGGAVGFIVSLYLFAGGIVPVLLFGAPIAVLAGLLSFLSYNNQPFSSILHSLVRFVSRKKMYMWRKSETEGAVERTVQNNSPDEQFVEAVSDKHSGPDKVQEMSANLVFSDEEESGYSDIDVVI